MSRLRSRLAACTLAFASLGWPAQARATAIVFARGPILGTTPLELDIEVGTGTDRSDVRFDMDEDPVVFLETEVPEATLRDGALVGVVTPRDAPSSARAILLYPPGAATFPWDGRHGAERVERGIARLVRRGARLALAVATPSGERRYDVRSVPVFAIERGSRADLRADRPALVIASQKTYDIHGAVIAVVVAAGAGPVAAP